MSSASPLIDLHGVEGQPFPNFGEEWTYLERVTMTTRSMAQRCLACESGMNPEEHDPQPIYMCWEKSTEVEQRSHYGFDEAWMECSADHPQAVPFWKDAP